ncbi:MAG: cell division protein FtsQ/DivIB [Acidimicrobiales bacterium]
MDPRIRRRRIEVRRNEGRRRLRVLLALLVILVVTGGGLLAVRSSLLDVDHIEVEGAARSTPEAVVAASGLRRGTAMTKVDATPMLAAIEGLPWVRRADVRRDWPGTVVITVEERVARAVSRSDSGLWALLDGEGRVLAEEAEPPAGLMPLEGVGPVPAPGVDAPSAGVPLVVLAALPPSLANRVTAIVAGERGEVELKLNPRGTVRFGTAADAVAKVRAIETLLASVDNRNLTILDVRFPSSPVLTRG